MITSGASCAICTRTTVSLTSLSVPFRATESALFPDLRSPFPQLKSRHVLTGSYNNYFHIYDREATTDVVLQADKSAFKAKKMSGVKNNKNGPGAKGAKGMNGKPIIDVDAIDFNKKILHGESSTL